MTDFTFKCPACDQPMISEIENAGRQIECPDCGATITLPNPPGDPEVTPPAILDAETESEEAIGASASETKEEEALDPIPLTHDAPAAGEESKKSPEGPAATPEEDPIQIPPTPDEAPLSPSSSKNNDEKEEEDEKKEDASPNLKLQD